MNNIIFFYWQSNAYKILKKTIVPFLGKIFPLLE